MIHCIKYILSFILLLACLASSAQGEDGGKQLRNNRTNPRVKTRISFSPVIGLYKTNKYHTSGARQKMALCVSVKEEIRLDKQNHCFFMVGAEYMLHGVSFNSYYFYNDSIKLYNGNMSAKYNLTIHELDFPVQIKYSPKKETNSIFSHYYLAGYCYRWVVASKLNVTNNGNEMIRQSEKINFKNPAFNPVNSSFFNIGMGIQKNTHLTHNAVFAELQFRYALSPFYFNESFAPTSMYINGHFIYLTVGFKI